MKKHSLPTYDSLAQCSGATGIPVATLRKLKGAGCPAFRSNRVVLKLLLKALFKNSPEMEMDKSRSKLMKAEAELAEQRVIAQSRSNVTEALTEAKAAMTKVWSPIRQGLMAFPSLLASRVNPMDPEMARGEIEKAVDDLLKGVHE